MKQYNGIDIVKEQLYDVLLNTTFGQKSLSATAEILDIEYTHLSHAASQLEEEGRLTKFKFGRKVIYKAL